MRLASLFIVSLVAPCFALAAPAAALEPAELKAELESFFAEMAPEFAPAELRMGEIVIEEAGAGLRVTLPDLELLETGEDRRFAIGTVAFLVAEPAPGSYAFSEVSLAERMPFLDGAGQEIGWVRFDLRRLSGLLDQTLGELTQLDLAIEGYEFRLPAEGFVLGFATATGQLATPPEASGGRHRQEQDYRVSDLVVSDPEATLELAELRLVSTIAGLDLESYRTLLDVFRDLQTAAERGDDSRIEALRNSMGALTHVALAADQAVTLDGLVAYDETGSELLRLESLRIGLDAEAPLGSDEGAGGLAFSGSGLVLGPALLPEFGAYADLVPHAWNLPVRLEKLPLEAVSRTMADLIFDLSLDPFSGTAPLEAGDSLLRVLGEAGTTLLVRDLFLEAALGRLDAKASLAFDPETPLGMVGLSEFTLFGLDRILVYAEGLADPEAKRWISAAVLGMMGVGKATALPDGRVGYRFSFLFAPDGEVSMNGFAFGDLLNEAIPQ